MFDNSTVALMAMIILAFIGMIVMFMFIMRALAENTLAIKDYQKQQQEMLLDVERLIREISFSIRHDKAMERQMPGPVQDVSEMLGELPAGAIQRLSKKFPSSTKTPPKMDQGTAPETDVPEAKRLIYNGLE